MAMFNRPSPHWQCLSAPPANTLQRRASRLIAALHANRHPRLLWSAPITPDLDVAAVAAAAEATHVMGARRPGTGDAWTKTPEIFPQPAAEIQATDRHEQTSRLPEEATSRRPPSESPIQ